MTEEAKKPRRGGSKPILKVSGIGKVDNNLRPTSFVPLAPINQKNYYTEYLKRDEQILFYRQQQEEQKKQKLVKEQKLLKENTESVEPSKEDDEEEEVAGSKTLIIHPGSRNLRIGLSSQAYPKTVPNAIAHRIIEDDQMEEDVEQELTPSRDGPQVDKFNKEREVVYKDFRERMKFYKRRVLPNSHEMVVNFNSRTQSEKIPDHNDPNAIEWTDVSSKESFFIGEKALNIPPDSSPRYDLKWPIRNGLFNEKDYVTTQQVLGDISLILMSALESELEIIFKEYREYSVVLIIPDLYDKRYVQHMIELILEMGFANVCILQEAMAATFGAGISTACIIDIGAQKTSITCVEDGMCIPDSRVHLKTGGDDVTVALIKLLLQSQFPYREINLNRTYDWLLADEIKCKFGTTNDADITVQFNSFYQRTPGQQTEKYEFKTFDEVMLAPLGYFYPRIFDLDGKLDSRYKLFSRSVDVYDGKPNDPISDAQINVSLGSICVWGKSYIETFAKPPVAKGTPNSSTPGTPIPETTQTAQAKAAAHNAQIQSQLAAQARAADTVDMKEVPVIGLDYAIIESITQAGLKSAINSKQNFYESIMLVGGGAKFSGFDNLLADRLSMWRDNADPNNPVSGDISVMAIPREMDPELITWKGGSVLAKLKIVSEIWITAKDWEILGSRCLQYKALFVY